jgi:hypothetical protein
MRLFPKQRLAGRFCLARSGAFFDVLPDSIAGKIGALENHNVRVSISRSACVARPEDWVTR